MNKWIGFSVSVVLVLSASLALRAASEHAKFLSDPAVKVGLSRFYEKQLKVSGGKEFLGPEDIKKNLAPFFGVICAVSGTPTGKENSDLNAQWEKDLLTFQEHPYSLQAYLIAYPSMLMIHQSVGTGLFSDKRKAMNKKEIEELGKLNDQLWDARRKIEVHGFLLAGGADSAQVLA